MDLTNTNESNFSKLLQNTKKNFNSNKNRKIQSDKNISLENLFKSIVKPITDTSKWAKQTAVYLKSNNSLLKDLTESMEFLKSNDNIIKDPNSLSEVVKGIQSLNVSIEDLKNSNKKESDQSQDTQNDSKSFLERLLLIFERKRYQDEEDRQEQKNNPNSKNRFNLPSLPTKNLAGFLVDFLSSIFLGPKGKSLLRSLIPASLGVAGLGIARGIAGLLLGPQLFQAIEAGMNEGNVLEGVGTFIDTFFKNTDLDEKLGIGAAAGFALGGIRGIIPGLMFGGAMAILQEILGDGAVSNIISGESGMLEGAFVAAGLSVLVGAKFGLPGILLAGAFGAVLGVINNDKFKLNVASITMGALGSFGGAIAGMKIGALIGSAGSPVGMIAGALLGAAIGLALGSVLSEDSKSEAAAKKYVEAAKAKKELLEKYNGDISKMTPEDLKLLKQYNDDLSLATEEFKSEGIAEKDISNSINLLNKPEGNDNLIAMQTADQQNYLNLSKSILSKTNNPDATSLDQVLAYDIASNKAVTKIPMKDNLGIAYPPGTDFGVIDREADTNLKSTITKLVYSDELLNQYDDEGNDEKVDERAKVVAQQLLRNTTSSDDLNPNPPSAEIKEPSELKNQIKYEKESSDPFPRTIQGLPENDNMRLRDPGEGELSIDNTDYKKASFKNNNIISDTIKQINRITNLNIKSYGELFEYDPVSRDLVFKEDKKVVKTLKTASGEEFTEIQNYKKGQSIYNLLPEQNNFQNYSVVNVVKQISDQIARKEGKYRDFYKERPPMEQKRNIISEIIKNNFLDVKFYKSGGVFNKPELFIAGESTKNNPEILFNRQQLLALGHLFNMQKENNAMREQSFRPMMMPPATSSNFVDNKRISVSEYNITEIPPEPNSSVSFRDNLLY